MSRPADARRPCSRGGGVFFFFVSSFSFVDHRTTSHISYVSACCNVWLSAAFAVETVHGARQTAWKLEGACAAWESLFPGETGEAKGVGHASDPSERETFRRWWWLWLFRVSIWDQLLGPARRNQKHKALLYYPWMTTASPSRLHTLPWLVVQRTVLDERGRKGALDAKVSKDDARGSIGLASLGIEGILLKCRFALHV